MAFGCVVWGKLYGPFLVRHKGISRLYRDIEMGGGIEMGHAGERGVQSGLIPGLLLLGTSALRRGLLH